MKKEKLKTKYYSVNIVLIDCALALSIFFTCLSVFTIVAALFFEELYEALVVVLIATIVVVTMFIITKKSYFKFNDLSLEIKKPFKKVKTIPIYNVSTLIIFDNFRYVSYSTDNLNNFIFGTHKGNDSGFNNEKFLKKSRNNQDNVYLLDEKFTEKNVFEYYPALSRFISKEKKQNNFVFEFALDFSTLDKIFEGGFVGDIYIANAVYDYNVKQIDELLAKYHYPKSKVIFFY